MQEDNSPPNRRAFVTHDLHCTNCEYNLRTLHFDSRCPECGTPVSTTLNYKPKKTGLLLTIIIVMILAAFVPWYLPLCFTPVPWNNPWPIFFASAIVEMVSCVIWIICGRRNMIGLRKQTATWVYYLGLIFGLSAMAFHAWLAYVFKYLAPNWG